MRLPRVKPKIMGVPVSIETAKGLTRASRDIFMRRFVPADVKQIRMNICMVCPSWEHTSNRCTECGCQMRVKASLTSSECPLKKWGRHVKSSDIGDSGINTTEHEGSTE
jgi:hypothetical protein